MDFCKYFNPYNWIEIMDECKNKHKTKEAKGILDDENGGLSLEQKKKN